MECFALFRFLNPCVLQSVRSETDSSRQDSIDAALTAWHALLLPSSTNRVQTTAKSCSNKKSLRVQLNRRIAI